MIKTWQERVKPEYHDLKIARDFMQAEIAELRAALAERDAGYWKAEHLAGNVVIAAQRKVLEQALEALQNCANGEDDVMLTREVLTAIQEQLK